MPLDDDAVDMHLSPVGELLDSAAGRCERIAFAMGGFFVHIRVESRAYFFFLVSDHNHQVDYFVAMVRAG